MNQSFMVSEICEKGSEIWKLMYEVLSYYKNTLGIAFCNNLSWSHSYSELFQVFTYYIGMLIHSWKVAGTVNSPLVTKGTFQFPTHGLAVVVK